VTSADQLRLDPAQARCLADEDMRGFRPIPCESDSDVIIRVARGEGDSSLRQNLDDRYKTLILEGRAVARVSVMEVMENAASTMN